jgi:hypothetical protein
MLVTEEDGPGGPRKIDSYETFKNRPFEDMWQEAIIPRFKLDKSYGDNLQDSHIT